MNGYLVKINDVYDAIVLRFMVCWNISVRLVERGKCQKIKQWIFRGSLTEANMDYSIQHSDKELIFSSSPENEPDNKILKSPNSKKTSYRRLPCYYCKVYGKH